MYVHNEITQSSAHIILLIVHHEEAAQRARVVRYPERASWEASFGRLFGLLFGRFVGSLFGRFVGSLFGVYRDMNE